MNRVAALALLLVIAGVLAALVGIALVFVPAAFIAGGTLLAAFGYAALRGSRP